MRPHTHPRLFIPFPKQNRRPAHLAVPPNHLQSVTNRVTSQTPYWGLWRLWRCTVPALWRLWRSWRNLNKSLCY